MSNDDTPRARALASRDSLRKKLNPNAGEVRPPSSDSGCNIYYVAANECYDIAELALSEGNAEKARLNFELGLSYTASGEACEALTNTLPT